MKTKSKILIGLMALCLAGAAGTTFALTRNAATSSGTAGGFDQAIYLNWGSDQQSVSITDVTELTTNVAQYRVLSVTPKSTKTVAGTVTLTFTLAATAGDYHVNGLTVDVFKTETLATQEGAASAISELSAVATVDASHLSATTTFSVTAASAAHETNAYYVMRFVYDGTMVTGKTMQGNLTIAQSFAA